MNSERNILSRLLEGNVEVETTQDLDEKTYTVGDTQYWKRGGKFYSWTEAGGRKECSEDEYMKAISGGSPKATEPHEDKSKEDSQNIDDMRKALYTDGDYSKDEVSKMSVGEVTRAWSELPPTLKTNKTPSNSSGVELDKKEVEAARKDAEALRYLGHKNLRFFTKNGKVAIGKSTDEYDYLESHGWSEVDGKEIGYEPPSKSPIEKAKDRQRRDPDYSSRQNYQGVSDFDHTTWDVGGVDTTIVETDDGYYLQNEDYDMEFPTQGDLIKYLRDNDAEFVGNDSESDY